MTPAPTAAQLAAAFRTLADALEDGIPDWMHGVIMEHCASSLAMVANWKLKQKPERNGHPCRHCERRGISIRFDHVRDLYVHAKYDHLDIMAARALKAIRA